MREPLFDPLQCILQFASPLRNSKTQPAHKIRQARTRQRCVDSHGHVDNGVNPRNTLGCVGRLGSVPLRSVDAHATLPPCHPQHAAVMHCRQQMRRRVRRTAPIVFDRAMREITIYFARMHCTVCPHKLQQKTRPFFARDGPGVRTFGRHARVRTRMHQHLYRSREETVHDKEILFDAESWIQAFEIAGMVILNAMTQYQVLSTSGRTDWISLNKTESVESTFQCRGLEKTAGDGKAAQIVQRNQHDSKWLKSFQPKTEITVQ